MKARQIIFKTQNAGEIGRIESDNWSTGAEHSLNSDDEIIRIHGGFDCEIIDRIGIIVWTPPKF